jgi:hypothetical protein
MGTVFVCAKCQVELTHPVQPLSDPSLESNELGTARIPRGTYILENQGSRSLDWYVVNLEDAVHTKHHSDLDRLVGCCGPDGRGGRNTLCDNGHEIGTECSDCCLSHFLGLDPESVLLKTL